MLEIIGAILPSTAAIAISPIPIIAVILMLMSPRSKQLGVSFLLGWLVGILVAVTIFVLLADVLPEAAAEGTSQPIAGTIQLVLGAGLLFLSLRQWRSRPAAGETPELPAWMSKIDTMKPGAALGLGFLLAAVNPKNLLVAASAGMTIGRGGLEIASLIIAILAFTVLAALTVLIPVLFALIAPKAASAVLTGIRAWLTAHNAAIMTVLLLVLGLNVVGNALGAF